jgi:hypothetical protein
MVLTRSRPLEAVWEPQLLRDLRPWAGSVNMQLMVVLSLLGCWSDTFEGELVT